MVMADQTRKFETIYCPHYKKNVSKSTYYEHYSKYFDTTTRTWQQFPSHRKRESDFDFEPESHENSIMITKIPNVDEGGDNFYDFMDSDDYCMAEDDHFDQQFHHPENIHNVSL